MGTVRLHEESFSTGSGKAIFPRGDWQAVKPFQDDFAPQGDELWVTSMRVNEHWQSEFDDLRIPYRHQRFPDSILEINPQDAEARGIKSSDLVIVENDGVLTQTGGRAPASFEAIAYVSDIVPPGVTSAYFNYGQGALRTAANSVAPGLTDPINNRYRYKLGKGRLRKIGDTNLASVMSFAPRNLEAPPQADWRPASAVQKDDGGTGGILTPLYGGILGAITAAFAVALGMQFWRERGQRSKKSGEE